MTEFMYYLCVCGWGVWGVYQTWWVSQLSSGSSGSEGSNQEHSVFRHLLNAQNFLLDLLCFSILMLRMDTNKVPKAEDTKKWKVWPTAHLVMFFSVDLISLCYVSSVNLLSALCHHASWFALCSFICIFDESLNPVWTFSRFFFPEFSEI